MRLFNSLICSFSLLVLMASVGCQSTEASCALCALGEVPDSEDQLMRFQDVDWTPLNPARGDKSPQAANLWGDRGEDVSTGFLVKFVDGFSSPPHIHNVTYRGVVIAGEAHNDDPGAANMWMPTGSFWTQPAGEVHITSAKGETNIAYIEIDSGPYLVAPPDQAFDNGERPVNVHKDNLVWVDQADGVEYAHLWGDPDSAEPYGLMVKLPEGFQGKFETEGPSARVVVISGLMEAISASKAKSVTLAPGSYISVGAKSESGIVETEAGAVLYIRAASTIKISER